MIRVNSATCILCCIAFPLTACHEQPATSLRAPTEVLFRKILGDPHPISELPSHVVAHAGQVTLFADYDHPQEGGIGLYLVNRSENDLLFPAKDGDPYIKLEVNLAADTYQRAQTHESSFCGNSSFDPPILRKNEFARALGYQPAAGWAGRIRYRIWQNEAQIPELNPKDQNKWRISNNRKIPINIVSNEGPGLWRPDEVEAARLDDLAASQGSFADIVYILTRDHLPDARFRRPAATWALRRFQTDESASLLEGLLRDDRLRDFAIQSLGTMENCNARAEAVIEKLLSNPNPHDRATALLSTRGHQRVDGRLQYAIQQYASQDSELRNAALCVIGDYASMNDRAREYVLGLPPDPDAEVRAKLDAMKEYLNKIRPTSRTCQ